MCYQKIKIQTPNYQENIKNRFKHKLNEIKKNNISIIGK